MKIIPKNRVRKLFGLPAQKPFRSRQKRRAGEINYLFDAMQFELGMRERMIFQEALGAEAGDKALSSFLHNVSGCPRKVLNFCRNKLAHGGG